jgi:SAM-dependent methyltransferase
LVDELGLGPGRWVADVAAGTGKLTRVLAATGSAVLAVEPMAGMRQQLRAVLPSLPVLAGTAESLPLRTASLQAVTVAQAMHWFRWPDAAGELRRVLVPGGLLAVVNNGRDARWPAAAAVTEVLQRYEALGPRPASVRRWREGLAGSGAFEPVGTRHLDHVQVFDDLDSFDARWASVSFAILLPDDVRARMLAELRSVVAAAGVDPLVAPLRTTVELHRRL